MAKITSMSIVPSAHFTAFEDTPPALFCDESELLVVACSGSPEVYLAACEDEVSELRFLKKFNECLESPDECFCFAHST